MAAAPCARCDKPVYPTEKLSCLDKTWHKGCFSCETCNLKLTMKNYKGYNKLPYCEAHYPTTKFTAVADTPENRRLQKNTANQSSVVYHKKFEEEKGAFQAVADTPEAMRLKKIQEQASDLVYKSSAPPPEKSSYAPPEAASAIRRVSQPEQVRAPPAAAAAAPAPKAAVPPPAPSGPVYEAIYDYTAADDDEVSFAEGDVITNVEVIDDGWMMGTVKRSGHRGMLPSNYVELKR